MQSAVTKALGYDESPNFLCAADLAQRSFSSFNHVYRTASERCGLQGAYLLRDPQAPQSETPIVFYCQAESEAAAGKIHQRIWNQGVVPFVLIETPQALRLYSGFRFEPAADHDHDRAVLQVSLSFTAIAEQLAELHAEAIDSGAIWHHWGQEVDPGQRVDWSLLDELERLETELRRRGLERDQAHALIGKFVYLKYLRDRQILSARKLARWNLDEAQVFSHRVTLKAFREVNARLNAWLNGSVFPIPDTDIRAEDLQLVASVFAGGTSGGQLALSLEIYDFSFIPIETLSVIYEQFLHADEDGKPSRGRRAGAYYTPIPLVSYVLGELGSRRPLEEGMRVLDPSCGSGAFLVCCYRTLIEKRLQRGTVRPAELRELLTRHIFGVDRDGDACQVAELSLILTLLDYTTPPDLENNPQFKLPVLRGNNIFQADFFAPDSSWARKRPRLSIDWLVGNPPWREVKQGVSEDRHAREWIRQHTERYPTGGNQVAEAFVWHSLPLLSPRAVVGLLLPAMTLFKVESARFRARLFASVRVWAVTNFANLAYVLFAGRSKAPALALFFTLRPDEASSPPAEESLRTFAPFLANQPVSRGKRARRLQETWSVVVNGSELRELRTAAVIGGDFRPWKEAMWGSFLDSRLLSRIARNFPTLRNYADANGLKIHEGFQLRKKSTETTAMPQLAGRTQVDFSKLKHCGRIFTFPSEALSAIRKEMAYLRTRGGLKGLEISEPPHLLIDASRRFAIYSDDFIAVPARKIGISGSEQTGDLLRALALYLSSSFCRYQQFFSTPEWGVRTSLATLNALRKLPIPLVQLTADGIRDWAMLQENLAIEYRDGRTPSQETLHEVDARVYQLLGLTTTERILIEDFVSWSLLMVQGKVPPPVIHPPADSMIDTYLDVLKKQLDELVGQDSGLSHDLHAVRAGTSAMLVVGLSHGQVGSPTVVEASAETARSLETTRKHLLRRHSQWFYFERFLKIYEDGTMYFFKPLEAIHWTRRQAILDAGEIVAETLGSQDT